jgi:hypothetical protein
LNEARCQNLSLGQFDVQFVLQHYHEFGLVLPYAIVRHPHQNRL